MKAAVLPPVLIPVPMLVCRSRLFPIFRTLHANVHIFPADDTMKFKFTVFDRVGGLELWAEICG